MMVNSLRPSDAYMRWLFNHPWFRWWLVAWPAPSHYLNQCWNIVIWTLRNELQWNFNWNSNMSIQENAFESVVCEMASISSRPQWVNVVYYGLEVSHWGEIRIYDSYMGECRHFEGPSSRPESALVSIVTILGRKQKIPFTCLLLNCFTTYLLLTSRRSSTNKNSTIKAKRIPFVINASKKTCFLCWKMLLYKQQ